MADVIRSNIAQWQAMQENDYFENHPFYNGFPDLGDDDCKIIEWFTTLRDTTIAVVIGCGYGRESIHIARRVRVVYGIDVSNRILDKAVTHTRANGVLNFTPVLAEDFAEEIPNGIDLVFSIVVFQHLTRDLAKNYLAILCKKLSEDGEMVIQFCDDFDAPDDDARLEVYEPSICYNVRQIAEMAQAAGLKLIQARSYMATDRAIWHWAYLKRDPRGKTSPPGR
jgi:cyclopropane fatty-acyl-phospholipid synthase-like methyltransferase